MGCELNTWCLLLWWQPIVRWGTPGTGWWLHHHLLLAWVWLLSRIALSRIALSRIALSCGLLYHHRIPSRLLHHYHVGLLWKRIRASVKNLRPQWASNEILGHGGGGGGVFDKKSSFFQSWHPGMPSSPHMRGEHLIGNTVHRGW